MSVLRVFACFPENSWCVGYCAEIPGWWKSRGLTVRRWFARLRVVMSAGDGLLSRASVLSGLRSVFLGGFDEISRGKCVYGGDCRIVVWWFGGG